MTVSRYYSLFASGLFFGNFLFLGVIMTTPQNQADAMAYLAFFGGLLLILASIFGFLGIVIRKILHQKLTPAQELTNLRQSLEASVVIVILTALQGFDLLIMWQAGLLIAGVILIEIIFLLPKKIS